MRSEIRAVLVVPVLALASCASDSSSAPETPRGVANLLNEDGVECTNFQELTGPSYSCDLDGDEGERVTLHVYEDDGNFCARRNEFENSGNPASYVINDRWAVATYGGDSHRMALQIADEVGGRVEDDGCS